MTQPRVAAHAGPSEAVTGDDAGISAATTGDRHPATAFRLDAARYRAIVEDQAELICRFLPDGTITFVNEAYCRYFRKTHEELNGTQIFTLMTEENAARQRKFLATLTPERPVGEIETGGVMPDGTVRWRSWTDRAIFDDQGRLLEFQSVGHDITDRKRAEEALRDSEEKLRSIVSTAADGIITIDSQGLIASFNPSAERMFGYRQHEVLGQSVEMLMAEPYKSEHGGYVARYLSTGEKRLTDRGREAIALRKDGTTFAVEITAGEALLGEKRTFTGIVRDITERKRIEERVRQREAELAHFSRVSTLGEMAAGLAHELNQPLSAIMNFAESCILRLQRDDVEPAAILRTMENISSMAERASEIIRGLRALVQKRELSRTQVDLNRIVYKTVEMARAEARLSQVTLETRLGPGPLAAYAEPIQIQQVLLNLIRNGTEVMQDSGSTARSLIVSTRPSGPETVEVAVADAGPGLAPEVADRLFQPFVTTKPKGLGMGLTICKSIIDIHGGRMWVEPNPDRGVTVRFTLPCRPCCKADD